MKKYKNTILYSTISALIFTLHIYYDRVAEPPKFNSLQIGGGVLEKINTYPPHIIINKNGKYIKYNFPGDFFQLKSLNIYLIDRKMENEDCQIKYHEEFYKTKTIYEISCGKKKLTYDNIKKIKESTKNYAVDFIYFLLIILMGLVFFISDKRRADSNHKCNNN